MTGTIYYVPTNILTNIDFYPCEKYTCENLGTIKVVECFVQSGS